MFEFIEYVLWELKNSLGLMVLAIVAAGVILVASWFVHKLKYKGQRKFPIGWALLLILFAGYGAVVVYATLLRGTGGFRDWNLHLFRAWREAWNNFSAKNWANVLLNVAMFVPLGFLLPLLWKKFKKWYITIPAGFAVSLAIELVQLAISRGICDVDDLFANTLGAVIGYLLIMTVLAFFGEKKTRLKNALIFGSLSFAFVMGICGIFLVYEWQEYGNLPMAPAYTNDTSDTRWILDFEVPVATDSLPVYKTQTRSIADCDAFAEDFKEIIGTEYTAISYYQEAAYYMDQSGDENGAHFLHVSYLDPSYEYSFIPKSVNPMEEPDWANADRATLEAALFKFPVYLPEYAEFAAEGEGWHSFTVSRHVDGAVMVDGTLRCRYASDGTIREIENKLLSYTYHDLVDVISPEEACKRLQKGKFYDGGYFEYADPEEVIIDSCTLGYEVDTKGFYQPVYYFELRASDGDYQDVVMIPARK